MNALQSILRPEALGWAAALLTMLTFISVDMRQLRLLALVANAAFIAYGSMAHLLPVMALHLALVPVNLWRLKHALRRGAPTPAAQHAPAQRAARQPGGWTPGRRAACASHRQAGSAMSSRHSVRPL
ncbi:MAG: hypothetical protein M3Y55_10780 [Pseudomonadota bacterium]|nr:hypothetical protein [Pseudomonadota bacterium]